MAKETKEAEVVEVQTEQDTEKLRENFINAVKAMYDSAMENVQGIAVSPLGFKDLSMLMASESLKTQDINARSLRNPATLIAILQDDTKFSSVMVELAKTRGMIEKFEKENTPIDVVESWAVAILIESSGIIKSKSEGN